VVAAIFVLCRFMSCTKYDSCINQVKDAKACADVK